jgi:hypothetical protein
MRVAALLVALLACAPAAVFASNAEGEKFLSENKEKEGVVTTKSGLKMLCSARFPQARSCS